jgi:hypothetical protein
LRKAGAALFVKTQNPQPLVCTAYVIGTNLSDKNQNQPLKTNNNICGRTYSPFNTNLTSGGSGGGEGAMITRWELT